MALLFSSCATNHQVEKLLVGKWKPVSAENLIPQESQIAAMQTIKVDTSTDPDVRKEIELTLPGQPDKKTAKLQRVIANEMNSPVMFSNNNNQKTVEKYYQGKTVKGNWKLKKQGKRMTVKDNESGLKVNLDILSLTDSTFVVLENLTAGDLKIKYTKVK
jgi:hypothetical protein